MLEVGAVLSEPVEWARAKPGKDWRVLAVDRLRGTILVDHET